MKFSYKVAVAILLIMISIISSLNLAKYERNKRVKTKDIVKEGDRCKYPNQKCVKGTECFAEKINLVMDNMDRTHAYFVGVCLKEKDQNYKLGANCLYKTFGTYCKMGKVELVCADTQTYGTRREKYSVGVCKIKKGQPCNNHEDCVTGYCGDKECKKPPKGFVLEKKTYNPFSNTSNTSSTSEKVKYIPEFKKKEFTNTEQQEIEFVAKFLKEKFKLNEYQTAFLILQYIVDTTKITNVEMLVQMDVKLQPIRRNHSCDDVELLLQTITGSHVISLWTEKEIMDYTDMVNKNYLEGINRPFETLFQIKTGGDKIGTIAELAKGTAETSVAQIGAGAATSLFNLAIETIANRVINNSLLAAYRETINSLDNDQYRNGQTLKEKFGLEKEINGIGVLNTSYCQEIKMNFAYDFIDSYLNK